MLPTITHKLEKVDNKLPSKGYCIRCEDKIPFDIAKPYCRDCYSEWNKWANEAYTETVCHCCGEYESTIRLKPLCYDCYNKLF